MSLRVIALQLSCCSFMPLFFPSDKVHVFLFPLHSGMAPAGLNLSPLPPLHFSVCCFLLVLPPSSCTHGLCCRRLRGPVRTKSAQINVWSGLALKKRFNIPLCWRRSGGDTLSGGVRERVVIACVCVSGVMLRKVSAIIQGCVAI